MLMTCESCLYREFSAVSARSYIDEKSFPFSSISTRCHSLVPMKVIVFAWRISLDRLITQNNHDFRGLDAPSL